MARTQEERKQFVQFMLDKGADKQTIFSALEKFDNTAGPSQQPQQKQGFFNDRTMGALKGVTSAVFNAMPPGVGTLPAQLMDIAQAGPRQYALDKAAMLPVVGGAVGMAAGGGMMSIPAAGAGATLGSFAEQGIRRGLGAEAAPPATFFGAEIPEIPVVGPSASRAITEGALAAGPQAVGMGITKLLSKGMRGGIKAQSPLSQETIDAYYKNPKKIDSALSPEQISQVIKNAQEKLRADVVASESALSNKVLSSEKNIPIKTITDKLKNAIKEPISKTGVELTPEIEASNTAIRKAIEKIESIGKQKTDRIVDTQGKPIQSQSGEVSEQQIRELIKQPNKTNYNVPGSSSGKTIEGVLSSVLKDKNVAYREGMAKLAEKTKTLDLVKKRFNLGFDTASGEQATDATVKKISPALFSGKNPEKMGILKKLEKLSGTKIVEPARDAVIKDQLQTLAIRGSRGIQLGAIGGDVGKVVAALMETDRGKITRGVLKAAKAIEETNPSLAVTLIRALAQRKQQNERK